MKDFVFDSLLPQVLVANDLQDAAHASDLFRMCKNQVDDADLQLSVDHLVTQFIEAASLADPSRGM